MIFSSRDLFEDKDFVDDVNRDQPFDFTYNNEVYNIQMMFNWSFNLRGDYSYKSLKFKIDDYTTKSIIRTLSFKIVNKSDNNRHTFIINISKTIDIDNMLVNIITENMNEEGSMLSIFEEIETLEKDSLKNEKLKLFNEYLNIIVAYLEYLYEI